MQTAGQYRLRQALSSCEVGDVWSGIDDHGLPVTIAVLNERASVDDRWRGAFAAAADTLAQAGADQLPIIGADHDGVRPWVACASERGAGAAQIFEALGQRLQPVAGQDPHVGEPTAWAPQMPPLPQQNAGQPAPTTGTDHNPWAVPAAAAAGDPDPTIQVPQLRPAASPAHPMSAESVSAWPVSAEPNAQPTPVQPDGPMGHQPPDLDGYPPPATPSSAAQPTPGQPFSPYPDPVWSQPVSGQPVSGQPVSGQPVSGLPVSGQPVSGSPLFDDDYPPYRSRVFGDQPVAKRKRSGPLLALAAVAGLLIGAAGAVAVLRLGDDGPTPTTAPTTAAALTDAQLLVPATPPTAPGVEPPLGGGWPSGWPTFTSAESTKPMNKLDGVGFDFRVPPNWNCGKAEQTPDAVHYRCGVGSGSTLTTGGDLIVRKCQPVCTEDRRTALRQREEAWGLRWTRSGPFTTWAETTQVDGRRVYGLVYVAFWRSTPEGEIDRELVLRMTAPLATSDALKKVANSVRDRTFTL